MFKLSVFALSAAAFLTAPQAFSEEGTPTTEVRPAWDQQRLGDFFSALPDVEKRGIDLDRYRLEELRRAIRRGDRNEVDALASRVFASIALDVRDGRVSPRIDFTAEELDGREIARQDILARMRDGEGPSEILASIRQDNPLQQRLGRALETYRAYEREDAWREITLSADLLEQGDTGADVEKVAARLRAEKYLHEDADRNEDGVAVFGPRLAAALKGFQRSRGLVPDGVVGPETLARMNVSEGKLVRKLKLNLERARWLPQDFSERYVLVNIAGYDLVVSDKGKETDRMKVIVGTDYNKTPVFAGAISYSVVNPYWNIPESIVREEIAPKVAENRNYLDERDMETVIGWGDNTVPVDPATIEWRNLPEDLSFRVRQKPGPENSLGRVKFMFPNDYAVYLHDTPADQLFGETRRAFSHGCIRVERPQDLAQWVWEQASPDTPDIERLFEEGERTVVRLEREIPVYIAYLTAVAGQDGSIRFFEDIYGRDEALEERLGLTS